MCDRMEELIRQTSCRDYQDQSIAQIFSMLGDSILLQTDLEEKGFPSSFDTALFIHPAFRPLYFRWISNPILDRGKISGWQLTGVEFNIPVEQSATFLPERKNVESTREHKNLYSAIINSMPGIFYLFDENIFTGTGNSNPFPDTILPTSVK